jgi:hypothetical protein
MHRNTIIGISICITCILIFSVTPLIWFLFFYKDNLKGLQIINAYAYPFKLFYTPENETSPVAITINPKKSGTTEPMYLPVKYNTTIEMKFNEQIENGIRVKPTFEPYLYSFSFTVTNTMKSIEIPANRKIQIHLKK